MSHTQSRDTAIIAVNSPNPLKQGSLVKLDANQNAIVNTAGNAPFGVSLEDTEANSTASVAVAGGVSGTVFLIAAATITFGDSLTAAANGQVTKLTGAGLKIGVALESSAAAGELIECVLHAPITVTA